MTTLLEQALAKRISHSTVKSCGMASSIVEAMPPERWDEVRELILAPDLRTTDKARMLQEVGIVITSKNLGTKIAQGGCKCHWCQIHMVIA